MLDPRLGVERAYGDPVTWREALELLYGLLPEYADNLREALQAGDTAGLHRVAHNLSGLRVIAEPSPSSFQPKRWRRAACVKMPAHFTMPWKRCSSTSSVWSSSNNPGRCHRQTAIRSIKRPFVCAACDRFDHAGGAKRFDDKAGSTLRKRFFNIVCRRVRTDHDDCEPGHVLSKGVQRFKAAHLLHADIQEQQIRRQGDALQQRFLAIARRADDFNGVLSQQRAAQMPCDISSSATTA